MRGGKRVSKGGWGGGDGDGGEGAWRGEVEKNIRACQRVGGGKKAKCGRVSKAAPEFGERGLSPKDVIRGSDKEGEVWPQKASRNVYHHRGPVRWTCVRLVCSNRDIQGEVVSVRVCGGTSN